jgi:DNA (cytosine-5)-methyltransferase 1
VGHSTGERWQEGDFRVWQQLTKWEKPARTWNGRRMDKPGIVGVVDGVAAGVERLKATGNGQVPRVAAAAFAILAEQLMTANA